MAVGVADNGIGVAPEFAEKVFVIFQRLHGREAYPGTGIGLALCRRIVEHHGGTMCMDPAYSGGTRVCFTLPAPADPAGQPGARPATLPPSGSGRVTGEEAGMTPPALDDRGPSRRG